MKKNISIIGASGFIGSNLLNYLSAKQKEYKSITVIVRNRKQAVRSEIKTVYCDHLEAKKLKVALTDSEIIYDTAGLAWQHPVGNFSKQDLLIEEIVQNSVSAYVIGELLERSQSLVWTSTSAIDSLFAKLSEVDQKLLLYEANKIAEFLCTKINIRKDSISQMRSIVKNLFFYRPPVFIPVILNFSYAYSKLLGQIILENVTRGNIRILKISDVYGPGQNISQNAIKENIPARRIQRFVAAYNLIKMGKTDWIPQEPKNRHGFSKTTKGNIVHEAWNDFLFPTYIEDIISMMIRAGKLDNANKTVLEVSGNKISNTQLIRTIQKILGIRIRIKRKKDLQLKIKSESADLPKLQFSRQSLISFEEGLKRWMKVNK